MRILKKNEIPYKEAKIYPEFELKDGFIKRLSEADMNRYLCRLQSFVKITRDGVDYLVLSVRSYEEQTMHLDKDKIDFPRILKPFKADCELIIKHYIVPENTELADGNELVIYKYID
jgi:hypothetical protein